MVESAPKSTRFAVLSGVVVMVAVLVLIRLTGEEGDAHEATEPDAVPTSAFVEEPEPRPAVAQDLDGIQFEDVTSPVGAGASADPGRGSAGVVVADFDADGQEDLYFANIGVPNRLYRNNGDGTFAEAASELGLQGADPANGYLAAAFADLTGDGCPDLYLAAAGEGTNQLLVSDCKGRYRDETNERGLAMPPAVGDPFGNQQNVVVAHDVDNDGNMDLLVMSWYLPELVDARVEPDSIPVKVEDASQCEEQNRMRGGWFEDSAPELVAQSRSVLYRNDGTGHFEEVGPQGGLKLNRILAVAANFADMNADGNDDLLVAGDLCTSRLYLNRGDWRFEDVTESSGVGTGQSDMGSVVRDINGDGTLDWFTTDIGSLDGTCGEVVDIRNCSGNRLFLNDGAAHFTDATTELGVRQGWFGWGAAIADFANSGELSIAQVNSFSPEFLEQVGVPNEEVRKFKDYEGYPMRFWVKGDDGRFVDGAELANLTDLPPAQTIVAFDFDRDGALDLVQRDLTGESRILRNTGSAASRHWLAVRLDDPFTQGNRQGVGAIVTVKPRKGAPIVQQVTTTGSFAAQVPPEVHVGLGGDDRAVSVAVTWPGCAESQDLGLTTVDQVLTVDRPDEDTCS